MKTKSKLIALALLALSATALAGFLPLWYDAPKRDNPNDPFSKPRIGTMPTLAPTVAASATPTPGPPPCLNTAVFNFESTLQGWTRDTVFDTGFSAIAQSTALAYDCLGSCRLDCVFGGGISAGGLAGVSLASLNFTGKTVSCQLYIPAGMSDASNPSGAFIYLKSGAGFNFRQATWQNLPSTAGWVSLSFDVDALASAQGWAAEKTNIKEVGIKVSRGGSSPNWSGTIYLDVVTY